MGRLSFLTRTRSCDQIYKTSVVKWKKKITTRKLWPYRTRAPWVQFINIGTYFGSLDITDWNQFSRSQVYSSHWSSTISVNNIWCRQWQLINVLMLYCIISEGNWRQLFACFWQRNNGYLIIKMPSWWWKYTYFWL